MKILGHGIDICCISRLAAVMERQEGFASRVFCASEIEYCRRKKNPYPHFAARFAAKEAYGKATGLGLGACGEITELEVVHQERGAPTLVLKGRALEVFQEWGGKEIFLSLSHDGDNAIASVIVTG